MTITRKTGSLVVVGTGINALAHCSIEAKSYIEQADVVFAMVTDSLTLDWLNELNSHVVNLQTHYQISDDYLAKRPTEFDVKRSRMETYESITKTICNSVRQGNDVVAAFYGHPGVFVHSSHSAISRLRAEHYNARMMPGISAEDCLYADLGIDPCTDGCAQYEATGFLFYKNVVDTTAGLILWQIGVLGEHTLKRFRPADNALLALTDKLSNLYPRDHKIVIYEAANFPIGNTRIDWISLSELPNARVNLASTIYIPPIEKPQPDVEALTKLDLTLERLSTKTP